MLYLNKELFCNITKNTPYVDVSKKIILIIWNVIPIQHHFWELFYNTIFLCNLFNNTFYLQIKNELTIIDPLKSMVILPKRMKVDLILNDLIQVVYVGLDKDETLGDENFINMSILSTQNYDVDDLNKRGMERFCRISCIYFSANIAIMEDGAIAILKLFKYLQNIALYEGLCMKLCLIITQLFNWVIDTRFLSIDYKRQLIFLPMMTLCPLYAKIQFKLHQRQFSIKMGFIMTINKSHGLLLKNLGIDLKS